MRFLWSWLVFLVALCVCQNATQDAQAKLVRALEILQQMPKCAQTCLLETVAAAGVTAGNIDLVASCANTTATAGIEECAMMTCTVREQLSAKNLTEKLCERPTHEAPTISFASLIGGSIAVVAYFMRLASKIYFPCQKGARIDNDLWWDDLTITIAFILLIPITVLSNILTGLGIGRDIWTLSPDNITQALKMYFIDEILYQVALPIIKIAILCTYLKIFTNKHFKWLVYGSIGLNVTYGIIFCLITIFQCTPVKNAWLNWDQSRPGQCNNINAQSWASAGLNIALDLVVVILPMPMLWNMNLNPRKKLLVMLMFGVGFFVTFVSILRLRLLVKFGDSKNISYDYKQVGYWTVIELDTALVCACMPGIRNLIRRAFPKLMGQSTHGTSALSKSGHNLSGRTAVGSGLDKSIAEVFVRPRHSDDGHFIPLQNVSSQKVHETIHAQVGESHFHHGRNFFSKPDSSDCGPGRNFSRPTSARGGGGGHEHDFSRPVSPPESSWQEWDGEKRHVSHSPA